jgi:hypothetical protein
MKTIEEESALTPEVMADLEYAAELAATGRKDAEFARRIRREAAGGKGDRVYIRY